MGRAREIADLIGGTTPDIILKTSDGAILNLQTSDTTVAADGVLGAINFQAPDEASGTDSILIASKIEQIENQVNKVNPDYLIIDTPGQIELFAYRTSGPFFVHNLNADEKLNLFLHDGTMVTSPSNFISVALLAASIKLRLGLPTVNLLTKTDLIADKLDQILNWSSNPMQLEESVGKDLDGETYSLTKDIIRSLNLGDFVDELIPISNVTEEGMVNLESAISRIINLGEEVED